MHLRSSHRGSPNRKVGGLFPPPHTEGQCNHSDRGAVRPSFAEAQHSGSAVQNLYMAKTCKRTQQIYLMTLVLSPAGNVRTTPFFFFSPCIDGLDYREFPGMIHPSLLRASACPGTQNLAFLYCPFQKSPHRKETHHRFALQQRSV